MSAPAFATAMPSTRSALPLRRRSEVVLLVKPEKYRHNGGMAFAP